MPVKSDGSRDWRIIELLLHEKYLNGFLKKWRMSRVTEYRVTYYRKLSLFNFFRIIVFHFLKTRKFSKKIFEFFFKIFQPVLDSSFLNNLIPLKSPPTMISGTMTDLSSVNNSANNSLISPSKQLINTSSQSNVKFGFL